MSFLKEFSASDVKASFLGLADIPLMEISYTINQTKNPYYAIGQKNPYTRVSEPKNYEGSMTMYQRTFNTILRSLPANRDPLDILPFTITLLYIDENTGLLATRILINVEFTEFSETITADSDLIPVSVPFVFNDFRAKFV